MKYILIFVNKIKKQQIKQQKIKKYLYINNKYYSMKEITDNTSLDKDDIDTIEMLKNKGLTFKGASKAFITFLVLWFLSKEDMHGYIIMKKIDEFFEPQIKHGLMKETKANKIYPLLKTMKENKLIESYKGIHNKKEVKIYTLTKEGKNFFKIIKNNYTLNFKREIWIELINELGIQLKT